MPYIYPKRTIRLARSVEVLAFFLLRCIGWLRRSPKADGAKVRSILLVEPFQMGDVVSLSVMFDPLKALWPDAKITILAQQKNAHLFKYDSRVHRTVTCPFPWAQKDSFHGVAGWRALWRTLTSLQGEGGFDVGMDTRGEIRSQLLMALCRCRRRIGYTNYMASNLKIRGLLLTDNLGEISVMHRYDMNRWVIGRAFDVSLPPLTFPTFRADGIAPVPLKPGKRQVVIHPGGGWRFKQWPEDRWVDLISALAKNDTVAIVLIGGENERDGVSRISSRLDVSHEARITSFEDLVGLFKATSLFIGLDSGPMNLAVALGVRTLALFGPGDSDIWYPRGHGDECLHVRDPFPCNPCFQRDCVFPDASCMTKIQVTGVIEKAQARATQTMPR